MPQSLFDSLQTFSSDSGPVGQFYSLPQLEKNGVGPISRLPHSLRVVLESEEKVCKESNRLCGIVMLKLFPEKWCFAGYCCANCSVKFGQSNVNRSRRCPANAQRCQQNYVSTFGHDTVSPFLHSRLIGYSFH